VFELALLQYFSPDLLDQRSSSEQQRLNRTSVRAVEAQKRALDAEDPELEEENEGDMAEGAGAAAAAAAASASMPMMKSKNKFAPRKALYIAPLKSATSSHVQASFALRCVYSHSVRFY
jgi:hypothetical protein